MHLFNFAGERASHCDGWQRQRDGHRRHELRLDFVEQRVLDHYFEHGHGEW